MFMLLPHVPTFAVMAIYLLWSAYQRRLHRRRVLCERVAYMLWTAIQPLEEPEEEGVAVGSGV
jgi:hypothetical protein